MKPHFFICLFALLLPFVAAAKDLTAIGFVKTQRRMNMMDIISAWRLLVRIKDGLHRVSFSKAKMLVEFSKM